MPGPPQGRLAIFPGSFDPLTNGHVDIILRSAHLFERIIVAVLVNAEKNPLFSADERVTIIREVFKEYPNIEVDTFNGLLVEYARRRDPREGGEFFHDLIPQLLCSLDLCPDALTMLLLGFPEIMCLLHGKPYARARAEGAADAQCGLRADCSSSRDNLLDALRQLFAQTNSRHQKCRLQSSTAL